MCFQSIGFSEKNDFANVNIYSCGGYSYLQNYLTQSTVDSVANHFVQDQAKPISVLFLFKKFKL